PRPGGPTGSPLADPRRVRRRVPVAERTVAAGHYPRMAEFPRLSLPLDTPPMEAKLTDVIPAGEEWQFEPKWDGFRCLAFRDGGSVEDRKSTRLNSSHVKTSYAVFCLKKK